MTARSTEHQSRRAAGKPQHFMRSRMVVMIGIHAVSPLRRPAMTLENRLEGRCGFFTSQRGHAPVEKDGEERIVRYPTVRGEHEHFRLHGRLPFLSKCGRTGKRAHRAGYDFDKSASIDIRHGGCGSGVKFDHYNSHPHSFFQQQPEIGGVFIPGGLVQIRVRWADASPRRHGKQQERLNREMPPQGRAGPLRLNTAVC